MNAEAEIESVARSYLAGERTLSELEDWLALNLPMLFQLDESAFASRVAARIEAAIAEMDAEGLGEDHVRDAIWELLRAGSLTVVSIAADSDATSNSNLIDRQRVGQPPEIHPVLGAPESPFSSSAVTEVRPAEPSYTSA